MVFYTLFTCHMMNQFHFFPHKNKKYVSIFAEVLSLCSRNVIVICCHLFLTLAMSPLQSPFVAPRLGDSRDIVEVQS